MLSYQLLSTVPDEELHQGEDDLNKVKHPCKQMFQINSLTQTLNSHLIMDHKSVKFFQRAENQRKILLIIKSVNT